MTEQLIVGFVRSPHGVAGEFKVESASGDYEHIEVLKEVTLKSGSVEKKFAVTSAKAGCGTLYMKLEGIDSPDDARKFSGWDIMVPRKFARPLGKDEWYIEDLKNCSLLWVDGTAAGAAPIETIGTITDVLEGGAGYLLEVSISESCTVLADDLKKTSSGKARKVLIPFTLQHVSNIDVKNKTIQLLHLWILE